MSRLGLEALDRGDFREGVRQYGLALKNLKRHGGTGVEMHRALYRLGHAHLQAGAKRKAIRKLRKSARLGSTRAAADLRKLE